MSYVNLIRVWRVARTGMYFASALLVFCAMVLAFTYPGYVSAQTGASLVAGSSKIVENIPTDVTRLALMSTIVLAGALVTCVTVGLRIMARMVDKFADTVNAMSTKPCLLDTERGLAVMKDKFERAIHEAKEHV